MDCWRVGERFEVIGATEHGPCSLLIYNAHQPKSKQRRFKPAQQLDLCKACVRDAIRHCSETQDNVGYGFGGDANCPMSVWCTAFAQTPEHHLSFTELSFMHGMRKKRWRPDDRWWQSGREL